jgi:hypothetical protein
MRRCALLLPLLALAFVASAPGSLGCGTKRQTETVTETIDYPAGSTLPDGRTAERDTQVLVTREQTTVTEHESGCGGVLSCTGKAVWWVVKLPFRIVGFVVDLVI